MPDGKPAGERCAQLTPDLRCAVFGQASRPAVCSGLAAEPAMCGTDRAHAMQFLTRLEVLTRP